MIDLRAEYEAARLLSLQSAIGSGIWVKELALPRRILFDTVENYRRICDPDCPVPIEGCSVITDDVTLVLYSHGWDVARTNFTLAHEIGHILLGHKGDDADEAEANRFASALTVPFAPLRALGRVGAREVSAFFGCSVTAAGYALKRTNVVSPYDGDVLALFEGRIASFKRERNPLDISCDL